jgi:hypothetical protein
MRRSSLFDQIYLEKLTRVPSVQFSHWVGRFLFSENLSSWEWHGFSVSHRSHGTSQSSLNYRYASKAMLFTWLNDRRFSNWCRLWVAPTNPNTHLVFP